MFTHLFEYLHAHAWLNGILKLALFFAFAWAVYRFVMGERGRRFREALPFLNHLYGRRQIRSLIETGEYAQAGDRLVALGQIDQAIEIYQQGNLFGRAADIYLRKKKPDRAAALYERAGEFLKAAETYLDLKMFEQAEAILDRAHRKEDYPKILLKRGENERALRVFLETGQLEEAAALQIELKRPIAAAETLLKLYETQRKDEIPSVVSRSRPSERFLGQAARLLEQNGEPKRAAQIYLDTNRNADAARCFQAAGEIRRAAEILEQLGDLKKASELFAREGDDKAADRLRAEHLFQVGELKEAAKLFGGIGDFSRAAEIHKDLGETTEAANLFEKAEEFGMAARLYVDRQMFERAGGAYERAGEIPLAVDAYERAGLTDRAIELLQRSGSKIDLAKALYKRGKLDEALMILGGLEMNDPGFHSSMNLRGKILLDQGKSMEAKEYFEQAISTASHLTGEDIDTIYNLALLAEQTQSRTKALEVLERLLAQDLVEKSALQKAENVRRILTERAFTRMSHISGMLSGSKLFAASDAALNTEATQPSKQRYVALKEIGRGGMGVVYLAKDRVLDRTVALKVLHSSFKKNEQAVQTFLREGKAAAALNHPNIVTIFDAGTQDGEYYIAMELLEGKTLKQILKAKGRLSHASVLEVLRQLVDALAFAHSQNIVHRDLSNNNIMWTKQKAVKIMDFGLAKIVRELASEQSIVGGTPSYMSPEQTLGNPIDHRTDIYSLGICLFEMALGTLPFTQGDLGFHHLHTPPPVPREKDPGISDLLNSTILRCLEKKPEDRFQSAADIATLFRRPK